MHKYKSLLIFIVLALALSTLVSAIPDLDIGSSQLLHPVIPGTWK
ncbi:MAG: hypothetical protein U5N58_02460 [Actinomycetota bacterium]|nr:hypothetical protein [Actinomycetota bacterium]